MDIYLGNTLLQTGQQKVEGGFISQDGETYYQIRHFNQMRTFFISVESDTDLWMYVGSTGGLTCGRTSPDNALFPYYTDDKLITEAHLTGPLTLLRVTRHGKTFLYEPFAQHTQGVYRIERTIAKSVTGNRLRFTEQNLDLQLAFQYEWTPLDAFGWLRMTQLTNLSTEEVKVEFLDGLQNIMPANVDHIRQNAFSTLVDAYKIAERIPHTALALYRMEATLVDRAEPSEALAANMVWCSGITPQHLLLTADQLPAFRLGYDLTDEPLAKGVRSSFFVHASLTLSANAAHTWYIGADVQQNAVQVKQMLHYLASPSDLESKLHSALAAATDHLRAVVAQNDGIQQSADIATNARHFANTLYNTMRGGYYADGCNINTADLQKHLHNFNRALALQYNAAISQLPETLTEAQLIEWAESQTDANLLRLVLEYLPLTFSRRHGDPSRPWNLFNIRLTDRQGKPLISYQGNWRDIFQNWEALSLSYPQYLTNIIAKFLNATTIDGYNPYKVTSEGIDWEVIEPENPWSNIGYWGDHQIIYLLKLLESLWQHNPQAFRTLMQQHCFAYANVPYRFKTYEEIVADPKNTITFHTALHNAIFSALSRYGQDARLLTQTPLADSLAVHTVSFTEKLLVTLLTKLGNFIPEAGIWMNTLRPEWNDANNALVGNGASMVTLCYLRRFLHFLLHTVYTDDAAYTVSAQVAAFFDRLDDIYHTYLPIALQGFTPEQRCQMTDALGMAAESYRTAVYQQADTALGAMVHWEQQTISADRLRRFAATALQVLDASISHNRRTDGLYQAYNIIHRTDNAIQVEHLYEMLEGQVAILSAFCLSPDETIHLLQTMRQSALYRADQRSYMLYPNRTLPLFLQKNNLTTDMASHPVVQHLLHDSPGTVLTQDTDGILHFNTAFNNASFLKTALDALPSLSETDKTFMLDCYEQLFHHHAFTGRSGTMYKYEGLGCIYWHMVSKLLLAVGENIAVFTRQGILSDEQLATLKQLYYDIQEGIGAHKAPQEYGSFPFDAYSHTPQGAGVQQPGMTGQVKEDILSRFFSLGVQPEEGALHFMPYMLQPQEFAADGTLRFTYCGLPVTYHRTTQAKGITLSTMQGETITLPDHCIPAHIAQHIFNRDNYIQQITVNL